jgi:hypothetical protein
MEEAVDRRTEIVKVQLDQQRFVLIEASVPAGEEDVALRIPRFDDLAEAIDGIADSLARVWRTQRLSAAKVQFGIEVSAKSGQLMALLVEGSGKANLTVTLEWNFTEGASRPDPTKGVPSRD